MSFTIAQVKGFPALLAAQVNSNAREESNAIHAMKSGRLRRRSGESKDWAFFGRLAFGATDCWHWAGNRNALGYGVMPEGGLAHRHSFEIFKGPIPIGNVVMHRCDNPSCVNPDHLQAGTQAENVHDMERKGRANHSSCFGERNPRAKLGLCDVEAIRRETGSHSEVAVKYGVARTTIQKIKSHKIWK